MSSFRVYFSYPNPLNEYSAFEEVTNDVLENSFGSIKEDLESNEFDVGALTFGNITLKMRNETAKYSEATNASSIFPFKRDRTLVKITWDRNITLAACGYFAAGHTFLSNEIKVFEGFIEDNASSFDVEKQTQMFKVLAKDSIIQREETPYSTLDVADDIETHIFNILNQANITKFLTVDASNISVDNNLVLDDITPLENTNCLEALQEILLVGNAVLYVNDNDEIIVRTRQEDASSSFIFYGPSSDNGIENISNISKYKLALNRCFNYWTWEDNSVAPVQFADSVALYGQRKKQLRSELITDNSKKTIILNSYLNEFGFPQVELNLTAPLISEIANLRFLNVVNIDYPSELLPVADDLSSRYSIDRYGEARYANTINSLFISISEEWKILNININTQSHEVTFKLRGVV